MQQFKVGDWVIEIYSDEIHQIIELFPDVCRIKKPLSGTTYCIEHTDITPWQPKDGEWCWSKKRNELTNNVCELIRFYWNNDNISDCEPFIGKLPTFLKDR